MGLSLSFPERTEETGTAHVSCTLPYCIVYYIFILYEILFVRSRVKSGDNRQAALRRVQRECGARLTAQVVEKGCKGKVDGPTGRRLWPPVGGGLCSLRSGGDSPDGLRVVVAASPQIFKKGARLRRGLCRRVVVRFAQGATSPAALRVVDCPSGEEYKASVTGLAVYVIWHDKHSVIGSLRSPPSFPLRGTSPASGSRIKHSMLSCRDMIPLLSTHSATTKWGKGGGASHQRGKLRNGT